MMRMLWISILAASAVLPVQAAAALAQVGQAVPVEYGTVQDVRPVTIQAGSTRLGAITGAVIGGAAGSRIGRGPAANVAGAAALGAGGATLGKKVQGKSGSSKGVDLTIKLDSGQVVAVIQPGDPLTFRPGDRVRVAGYGESVRVSR